MAAILPAAGIAFLAIRHAASLDSSMASAPVVTVDVAHRIRAVPSTAIGINTAVWDGHLQDWQVPSLLRQIGVAVIRFPGGSTSDTYDWRTNSIVNGQSGSANPDNTFDRFMRRVVQPAGATAMVTVNYGSNASGTRGGDPNAAAAWVRHAREQRYRALYWEIGNEIYGNGYYGAHWETDLHKDRSPSAYAANALAFIRAMKAANPSVKIGLVLTAPGNWPDGQGPQRWNETVLSRAGKRADFVAVHWYAQQPGQESDAGLLSSPSSIPGMVSKLRDLLRRYASPRRPPIMVTETNSVAFNPGKQTTGVVNGLFLIEDYLTWLQAGVANVSWWDLHNSAEAGNNNSPGLAGSTRYGDYGVLASGDHPGVPPNHPYPTYTALQLLRRALQPGSAFVRITSSVPTLKAFALRQPHGKLALVMINTSRSEAEVATSHVSGTSVRSPATSESFGLSAPRIATSSVRVSGDTLSPTLPPYSATVIQLHG